MIFPFLPFMVSDFFPELEKDELGKNTVTAPSNILSTQTHTHTHTPQQARRLATLAVRTSLATFWAAYSGAGPQTSQGGDQ